MVFHGSMQTVFEGDVLTLQFLGFYGSGDV